MRDGIRRRRGGSRKPSGLSKALILALIGVATLILVGIAVLVLLRGGGKGNPFGPGFAFNLPNAKVNEDSYIALRSGATLAEVEAILGGAGRAPTATDFDAICGGEELRFTNPYFRERPMWEENNRRGVMRVWTNGKVRILLTFSQAPEAGGQLVVKVLQDADGSVTSISGGAFGPPVAPNAPPAWPNAPARPNAAQPGGNADWNQFVGTWEVEGDPRFRIRFGADLEIGDIFLHEGRPVREKVYKVRNAPMANGRMTPQLALGTVNGADVVNATMGTFWFENGKLHRDPGNGKPIQTLKRVG